jgi:PAS domain-containing protein
LAFPQMRRQEVLGQTFWNVFPRASELKFYPYLNKAMNERVTQEFEEYSPSANCWFFVKAYPTREGLSVSLRDISDKILLQDNLRIEQRNLLSLINNSPDIIWSVDHEYRLLSFNHGYAEVIKLWSGQMPRKGVCTSSYARGDEDRVEWEAYYNRALKGEMFQFESNYLLGEYERCIDTRIYPIRDVDHKVIGVSCNSRDITDYRKQLRLAEAQNQRLRDIAWIQSHKVRAPLASILGLVELYERETPSDVNNVDLIDKIKLAASELDRVIHELVGATRLDLHTPMDS